MSLHLLEPADLPIPLSTVKDHLRVGSDEDDLITLYLRAAVAEVEGMTRRQIATARWCLSLDAAPQGRVLELPRPPLQSVETIVYTAPDGSVGTMAPESYAVDPFPLVGRIVLRPGVSWPALDSSPGALRIEYTAGWIDVPADLQAALLLIVGHRYANREDVVTGTIATPIPMASKYLLEAYRGEGLP